MVKRNNILHSWVGVYSFCVGMNEKSKCWWMNVINYVLTAIVKCGS